MVMANVTAVTKRLTTYTLYREITIVVICIVLALSSAIILSVLCVCCQARKANKSKHVSSQTGEKTDQTSEGSTKTETLKMNKRTIFMVKKTVNATTAPKVKLDAVKEPENRVQMNLRKATEGIMKVGTVKEPHVIKLKGDTEKKVAPLFIMESEAIAKKPRTFAKELAVEDKKYQDTKSPKLSLGKTRNPLLESAVTPLEGKSNNHRKTTKVKKDNRKSSTSIKSTVRVNKGKTELISLYEDMDAPGIGLISSKILYAPPSNLQETIAQEKLKQASTIALSSKEDLQ